jgi:hypothetical protein
MVQVSSSHPEELTSEERWRRWEQRGRDNDARFLRRARMVLTAVVTIAAGVVFVLLLR